MASIKDEAVPGVGTGILHPFLQHRWRFIIKSGDGFLENITGNIVKISADYKNSNLILAIQENILGLVSDDVYELCSRGTFNSNIECLDGSDGINFVHQFINCVVAEHNVEYDYSKSGIVTHHLKLDFQAMRTLYPETEEA